MANRREFEEAVELLVNGVVKPVIDKEFTLDQIKEAHAYLESGEHVGKVLIKIG